MACLRPKPFPQKGIRWMRLSHGSSALSATFDDPNLVSAAGLAPVLALAQDCRLGELVADKLTLRMKGGVNARLKVPALVAGMVAGADSIDDMDLLRHGGMDRLFAGIRAPSTLGTFLRAFTFGHVRQLEAVVGHALGRAWALGAGPGSGRLVVDVDSTVCEVVGKAKAGAAYGYTRVLGYHPILATRADTGEVSTPAYARDRPTPLAVLSASSTSWWPVCVAQGRPGKW